MRFQEKTPMHLDSINFHKTFVVAAMVALCMSESTLAQSLFERRSPNQVDQYRNFAARRKGDLLTVLITESTDVENIDARTLDKDSSTSVAGTVGYGFGGGLGTGVGSGTIDQTGATSRAFSGDSEFRSERQFLDRFTVTVADVLPNGNLIISGRRNIAVQGDNRILTLTGVVRSVDLLADNSVPSRLVANLNIQLDGKGPEQKFVNQGWLGRRLNKKWPF